jgi:hypothetical protein
MRFKKLILSSTLLASALIAGGGCSAFKDMDNMTKTTQQVSDTSSDMKKTMNGMAANTVDLLNLNSVVKSGVLDTYYKLRQGNTLQARDYTLKHMDSATSMEDKIAWAGAYFQAYEFQLWDGSQKDDRDRLESLYLCGIQEFNRDMMEYIPQSYDVDPTSKNNKMMDLYALAVTMHELNTLSKLQPFEENKASESVSMFDLVKHALQLKNDVESGAKPEASLEEWEREGLRVEQELDYIIQIRENFLPVMALAKISKIAENGFLGIPGLFRQLDMLLTGWDADLSHANLEQLLTYTSWVQEAVADRDFLKSIGANSRLNDDVMKIYKNMRLPEKLSAEQGSSSQAQAMEIRSDAYGKLKDQIDDLKQTNSN